MREGPTKMNDTLTPLFTIGLGGQSIVYLAYDHVNEKLIALKVAKSLTMSATFEKEFQTLAMLNHPNIIKLEHKVFKSCLDQTLTHSKEKNTEEQLYFGLELSHLGSLYEYVILSKGGFDSRIVRYYAKQMITALECIHSMGVVHKDFKLENLLLFNEGTLLKLTDFGCCASLMKNESDKQQVIFSGTDFYIAPEIYKHEGFNQKADIFSLGVCLYIMMYGKLPFSRATVSDKTYRWLAIRKQTKFVHLVKKSVSKEVDQDFMELLLRMWEIDPSKRATFEEIKGSKWLNQKSCGEEEIASFVGNLKLKVRENYMKNIANVKEFKLPENVVEELNDNMNMMQTCYD